MYNYEKSVMGDVWFLESGAGGVEEAAEAVYVG